MIDEHEYCPVCAAIMKKSKFHSKFCGACMNKKYPRPDWRYRN